MDTIFDNITSETVNFIYKQWKQEKNKKKIKKIINSLTNYFIESIQPYLYTIIAILVILFSVLCIQFYYYMMSTKRLSILLEEIQNGTVQKSSLLESFKKL